MKTSGEKTEEETQCYEYELIGVTVHTGTADGGHYYAFIRENSGYGKRWYSFNDAEVKPFDANQIASECFGGEMNSRTYDQMTDKFMDLSIEKTNSAYMLFYERIDRRKSTSGSSSSASGADVQPGPSNMAVSKVVDPEVCSERASFTLKQELEEWIWKDNMNFIQDRNIFDHTYFK